MKSPFCLLFFLVAFYASAQRPDAHKLGVVNYQELKMDVYPKDVVTLNAFDNGLNYSYTIEFNIRKTFFSTEKYLELKDFYSKVVDAESYLIKLQKTNE